jgi:tetratricopeptide (TPR) repeat protein/HEAT repeat protein
MTAIDPFHPLLRLMDRYRQDVHHLRPAAVEGAFEETAEHLGQELPPSLTAFLARWNGAVLFRGVLRLRSTAELAPAHQRHPSVILFADGPKEGERWAFVKTDTGHVFGRWRDEDGECALEPQYLTYHRWLMGMLQLLEQAPRTEEQRAELQLTCDPQNPFLLLKRAEDLIAAGDPAKATSCLRQATVSDPALLPAWQRLGDVLVGQDPGEARFAYIKALRAIRLPVPYPGAPTADPDLIGSLEALFDPEDAGWERELRDLLDERVTDVRSPEALALVEAAALAYARVFLCRGDRQEAATFLSELVKRGNAFACRALFPELRLLLARLLTDLGNHNQAEESLRPLERQDDAMLQARARLALGRIVVARQEPWAEEILEEALLDLSDENEQSQVWLSLAERHLLLDRPEKAAASLGQARELLHSTGNQQQRALLAMLEGDLERLTDALPEAMAAYGKAEKLAQLGGDPELRWRLALRAGDLAALNGDIDQAREAWRGAKAGFEQLNLPIRRGWALLRLGRAGDRESLRLAGELFKAADLAAGVAAVDAAKQRPQDSLAWHIERASEHTRVRAEAQRAKPPLKRADADRPERRLGAHQVAVAACDASVVAALAEEISQSGRALESATLRAGDPRLARYVAALDLLAHHRSYEAARALLDHLATGFIPGLPGRALESALARSPNAALVAGLLDTLEEGQDPVAVARAAEVLGWRRERAATERLLQLARDVSAKGLQRAAIMALGRVGSAEAIEDIAEALEVPELGEAASIALLLLGDRRGVNYHAQLLGRGDTTRGASPGEIVGRYGDPSFLLLLKGSVARDEEVARGALMGLGYLGDPRAVELLIDSTARPEARVAAVASSALEILTGHHEPAEAPDLRLRWRRAWAEMEKAFINGTRYRYGRKLDPGVLIARLGADDLLTRRSSYDELVITTGVHLPFDADGAWRIQVHHRIAWERWWLEHRAHYTAGAWTFHGDVVS